MKKEHLGRMEECWRNLMERHPEMFEHLWRPPECYKGWYDLLDALMTEIEALLVDVPKGEWPRVVQIKEKFGGLSFYAGWDHGDDPDRKDLFAKIEGLILEAESHSYDVCDICGKSGSLRKNRFWIRTLCNKCDEENSPIR